MPYDGTRINLAEVDVTDISHEFDPDLQAPVEKLLGKPWYMESSSPGGDYVTWLALPDGRLIGVSPHPHYQDNLMRWYIALDDAEGNPVEIEHELLITTPPEQVVAAVRAFMAKHGIEQPGGGR